MADSDGAAPTETMAVLPHVADSGNRRVLRDWLEQSQYELVEGDPETADFDLCILDVGSLERSREALAARRRAADHLLPALLLVPDSMGDVVYRELRAERPGLWDLVDAIVRVPIRKYDLADRIDSLLRLRSQSAALARRETQLDVLNRVLRHDIRNDMTVVLGWLDVLAANADETEMETIDRIEAASEHVVELTSTAGHIAEALTGSVESELRPISLTRVLTEEVEKCAQTFETATFEVPRPLPEVVVEADDLLSSVVRNLLNNAVQHNTAEEPAVEVDVTRLDGWARVRVADNGPGIPDAQKEAIFGDEVHGPESIGIGMGLYLVSTIVDLYGGRVWVEDAETGGAAFVVELGTAE